MIKNIPPWDKIKVFGRLKALNAAYYVFVGLPIAIKLVDGINSIGGTIGGNYYSINLLLPFSWKMLYVSSIFITIGNLLYYFMCPELIRNIDTYDDYLKTGKNKSHLYNMMIKYFLHKNRNESLNKMTDYYIGFAKTFGIDNHHVPHMMNHTLRNMADGNINGAYLFVRDFLDFTYPSIRGVVSLSYGIGVILFLVVIVQKVVYTIGQLL